MTLIPVNKKQALIGVQKAIRMIDNSNNEDDMKKIINFVDIASKQISKFDNIKSSSLLFLFEYKFICILNKDKK